MAVRFPGTSGNFYARSSDLPAIAALTASWYVKLAASVTDRNNPFTIYENTTNFIDYQTRSDNGTLFQFRYGGNGSNVLNVVDVGVGNWYFMALVVSGATLNNYYAAADAASLSVVNTTASSASWWTPAHMRLSQRPDTFGRINGTIANVKIWTAALSQAELEIERLLWRPARLDGLHLWTPVVDLGANRVTDYSGAGRSWSPTGASIIDEDGPPLMWGALSWLPPAPPAAPPAPDEIIGRAYPFAVPTDGTIRFWPEVDGVSLRTDLKVDRAMGYTWESQ